MADEDVEKMLLREKMPNTCKLSRKDLDLRGYANKYQGCISIFRGLSPVQAHA